MTQNDIADRLDALEAQLDDQQKTIERQQERIEAQEAIINAQQKRLDADGGDADDSEEIDANGSDADGDDSERAVLNRRTALQAGGVLGLLGLGAGTASADASGQIGTSSDPLQQLYTEELNGGVTGDAQLTNIAGSNLSIDSSGNLNASGSGSDAWVEGDNTSLLEPVSKDGIEVDTIADNGSGSVTMNSTLDLNGYDLKSSSYGNVWDLRTNSTVGGGQNRTFSLEISDDAGSDNDITWQRAGNEDAAFRVVDRTNDNHILTVNDGGDVDVHNGNLDLNGNNVESSAKGLTVTTNNTGDLTLDPGGTSELNLSNQTTGSSGSLLAIDGSGNVVEASGTTLSDVGGGGSSSSLVTSTNSVTAVEVIDGGTSVSASPDSTKAPNVIGGHPSNNTGGNTVQGVTISGGGYDSGSSNDNTASADFATVGGGEKNTASGSESTVGGGIDNTASNSNATVGGGDGNTASGNAATVGGGFGNEASGTNATVPGGANNAAKGNHSFAAGNKATAWGPAFVWGDSSSTGVREMAPDQVVFQAGGGMYIGDDGGPGSDFYNEGSKLINTSSGAYLTTGGTWTDSSSRAVKHNIDPVDGPKVLEKVTSLPVSEWTYDDEPDDVRHMGPMAEDFYETFGLGADDEHIASLDSAGVALAAIKGLSQKLDDRDDRIDDLEAENEQLREHNAELEDRLAAVEAELGIDATASQQGVADD